MPPFLRENAVIILGLTLPLILMLALLLLRTFENSGPPPTYEIIFALHNYNYPAEITVKEEKLHITLLPFKDEYSYPQNPLTIYRYNPATDKLTAFNITQDRITTPTPYELPAELAALRLNDNPQSPDGYRLVRDRTRNGNIFSEIFFSPRNHHFFLQSDERSVPLPTVMDPYRSEKFIGWVIPHE